MKKRCFTMIEMVVVVLLIALLAAIATPMYFGYLRDARQTAAENQLKLFKQALVDYSVRMGGIPTTEQGLSALIVNPGNAPKWRPFLEGDTIPADPWGNKYVYRTTDGGGFELISFGEDGKSGGEGYAADITVRGTGI